MLHHLNTTKIITANTKDFPSCVFNIDGVISVVKNNHSIQSYSLLSFSRKKFDLAYSKLLKVK